MVSLPVSERLLSAGDMIVLDGLRIGAARRALPGLALAVEETVMLCVAAGWGNVEWHERLLDRRRPFDRVKQGWRCPMSKWFRFASLALRLSRVGQDRRRRAVRQTAAGGISPRRAGFK